MVWKKAGKRSGFKRFEPLPPKYLLDAFFSVSRFLPVGWIIINVLVSSTAMKYSLPTFESENYLETLTIKILWQLFQLFVFTAAITCPGLPSPRNGTRLGCSGNATEFYDTVCQFGCNNGYVGSGSHIRRCQENETWSGEEFICQSTSNLVVMLENVALDLFFSRTNTKEEIIITRDGNDAGYRRYSCAIGIFI